MKNILVSIDFNTDENLLLDHAYQLAKAFGSKVWILHIAAPNPDFVGFKAGPQFMRDMRASELRKEHKTLQNYALELKAKGIDTEALLIQGPTIEMLLEETEKLNIDLFIIGHHEHSFLYKLFVGSVSDKIIQKSKIPLLIIPLE
ncbi:MAG: universal stress protein [Flavobacteriaceae bacterium]|nr:universal stress protein [Flavobacteriaceae bacterium]